MISIKEVKKIKCSVCNSYLKLPNSYRFNESNKNYICSCGFITVYFAYNNFVDCYYTKQYKDSDYRLYFSITNNKIYLNDLTNNDWYQETNLKDFFNLSLDNIIKSINLYRKTKLLK